jgi:hypothetical protein
VFHGCLHLKCKSNPACFFPSVSTALTRILAVRRGASVSRQYLPFQLYSKHQNITSWFVDMECSCDCHHSSHFSQRASTFPTVQFPHLNALVHFVSDVITYEPSVNCMVTWKLFCDHLFNLFLSSIWGINFQIYFTIICTLSEEILERKIAAPV